MEKKILVVDDNPEMVQLLSLRLIDNNYKVLNAYNGKEALDIAKRENPDLIILDIIMPELDGAKTASLLKENPKTKDIPIIFLTGLFTKEDEKKGSIRGNMYVVAKPYDGNQLLKAIKKNIRK